MVKSRFYVSCMLFAMLSFNRCSGFFVAALLPVVKATMPAWPLVATMFYNWRMSRSLEYKIQAVKEDTEVIKQDAQQLKKDAQELKVKTSEIQGDTRVLRQGVQEVKNDTQELKQNVQVLQEDIQEVKQNTVNLEQLMGGFRAETNTNFQEVQGNIVSQKNALLQEMVNKDVSLRGFIDKKVEKIKNNIYRVDAQLEHKMKIIEDYQRDNKKEYKDIKEVVGENGENIRVLHKKIAKIYIVVTRIEKMLDK